VAIFRGHLSHSSFSGYLFGNISAPIPLSTNNWEQWGRGRLLYLKFSNEYLYRKLDVEFPNLKTFDIISKYNVTGKYLNFSLQNNQFKYVIYAEGNCGWADRLKLLLNSGMVIILQHTPCVEYFTEFLKPYVHYIPVDTTFSNISEAIHYAETHDEEVKQMIYAAHKVAETFISVKTMKTFVLALITKYANLLKYKVKRNTRGKRYLGSNYTCKHQYCEDNSSFIED